LFAVIFVMIIPTSGWLPPGAAGCRRVLGEYTVSSSFAARTVSTLIE
jgi:hypothetical protein